MRVLLAEIACLMLMSSLFAQSGEIPFSRSEAIASAGHSYLETDPFSVFSLPKGRSIIQVSLNASRPYRSFDQNVLAIGFNRFWKTISGGTQCFLLSANSGNKLQIQSHLKLRFPSALAGCGFTYSRQSLSHYVHSNTYKSSLFGSFKPDKNWTTFAVCELESYKDRDTYKSRWLSVFGLRFKSGPNTDIEVLQQSSQIRKSNLIVCFRHLFKDRYEFRTGVNFNGNCFGFGIKRLNKKILFSLAFLYNSFLGMGVSQGLEYAH